MSPKDNTRLIVRYRNRKTILDRIDLVRIVNGYFQCVLINDRECVVVCDNKMFELQLEEV